MSPVWSGHAAQSIARLGKSSLELPLRPRPPWDPLAVPWGPPLCHLSQSEAFQMLPVPLVINENLNILLPGLRQGFGKLVENTPVSRGLLHCRKTAGSSTSPRGSAESAVGPLWNCLREPGAHRAQQGAQRLGLQGQERQAQVFTQWPCVPGSGNSRWVLTSGVHSGGEGRAGTDKHS